MPLIAYAGTCTIKKVELPVPHVHTSDFYCGSADFALELALNKEWFYKKVQNVQKIHDEVGQHLQSDPVSRRKKTEEIYPQQRMTKIASYRESLLVKSIKMPFGRGGKGASGKKAARWLHKQLVAEVPVIKKVVKNAKRLKCNYLVFPVPSKKKQLYMETKGFLLIGQVNEYGIFKYYE
ncbi:MAG: hypothetical protein ACLVBP_00180 [Ruminococcus sp.]